VWTAIGTQRQIVTTETISETDKQIVMALADAFEFGTNRHYSPFMKTSHRAKTKSHGTIAADYF
jgi:hypothetical protein